MTVVDRFVQAVSHGDSMRPTLQVVHAAETPLRAGYAESIAENWFGRSAPTSAHFMVDPVELIRMLSDNVVSYAVGPKANGFTLNWEQAGYSRFSRAEWTTADGMAQMDRLGAGLRERGLANGIPLRWASDDDIRAAARGIPGGICFHDDIRRVLGGTTHTDPMPHYPGDLLMALVNNGEDDEMAGTEALELLREIRAQLTGSGTSGQYPGLPDLDGLTVVQALAALGPVPNAVADVRAQLTGSGSPGQYPGLPDLADADGRRRTVVQALAALLASSGDRGQLLTIVTSAVTEALGQDNDQLAQDIVARLGRALTRPAA